MLRTPEYMVLNAILVEPTIRAVVDYNHFMLRTLHHLSALWQDIWEAFIAGAVTVGRTPPVTGFLETGFQ